VDLSIKLTSEFLASETMKKLWEFNIYQTENNVALTACILEMSSSMNTFLPEEPILILNLLKIKLVELHKWIQIQYL